MKTYEAIRKTQAVNEKNEKVSDLAVGQEISGELIDIDNEVYVESKDGYVKLADLSEVIETPTEKGEPSSPASSTSKKMIMALVGLAIGFGIARYKKMSIKGVVICSVVGLSAGLLVDYFHNKRKAK